MVAVSRSVARPGMAQGRRGAVCRRKRRPAPPLGVAARRLDRQDGSGRLARAGLAARRARSHRGQGRRLLRRRERNVPGQDVGLHAHHRSALFAGTPGAGNARRGARYHGAQPRGGGAARERGTLPVAAGEPSALRPRDRSQRTVDLDERRGPPDAGTHRSGPGPRAGVPRRGLCRGPAARGRPAGAGARGAFLAIRVRRCRRRRAARLRVVLRSGLRERRHDPQAHRHHRGHHGAPPRGSRAARKRAATGAGVVGRGARHLGPGSPNRPADPERALGGDAGIRARRDRRVDAGMAGPGPSG